MDESSLSAQQQAGTYSQVYVCRLVRSFCQYPAKGVTVAFPRSLNTHRSGTHERNPVYSIRFLHSWEGSHGAMKGVFKGFQTSLRYAAARCS